MGLGIALYSGCTYEYMNILPDNVAQKENRKMR